MLDIKLIRENPELVKKNLKKRNDKEKLKLFEELIAEDKKWRAVLGKINDLRQERNKVSLQIAELKKQGKGTSKVLDKAKQIPEKIKKLETDLEKHEGKSKDILMRLPNLLHDSVPFGKDDTENVEIRKIGKPVKFDFEPKDHLTILKNLGMIDEERAAKVAGHGFYYLKGDAVLLDMALQKFAMDFLQKKGFTLIEPPPMMNRDAYLGVTDLEFFGDQLYKIENENLFMIATSEHPMVAAFMNEVIEQNNLPAKFAGVSPCFRREVGAHGKYTKGLFRVHNFNKVEQVVLCKPEESWKILEEIENISEELYKQLGLHFRVVNVCTGDIGIIAAKKYDIEFWMADGNFREIGSCSNCTDFQARRLNIKFKEGPGKPPAGLVHTLNNTAFATSRTMIAIIEQFQQKDGSVLIPKALQPYMNGIEKLVKKNKL